ncbi:SNARE associated Golgi protein [Artemisia annua]|uniref:SNARE associated Golgi protein n=1 Tax=Artemisia annua TaxID=35608 RepID=A0A2U1ND00_ARTAN|nr:SNARE associated Golgi protein [Artemisia annua]
MTDDHNNAGITQIKVDPKPDYVIVTSPPPPQGLTENETDGGGLGPSCGVVADEVISIWWSFWWWGKFVFLVLFLGLLGVSFFLWIGPYLMEKEVIPILNWETTTFSKPMLAFLIFASVAIFPSIFIPSTPSMWVAGMSFGYLLGFLLIICGVSIGVSLPYFFGSLLYPRIKRWLEKYPKKASIIRLAGEGDWYDQFRAVTLLRISPFPYVIYNYCAVATDVKFVPYLFGTLVGIVPEVFVAIYTGIMIRTLADASKEERSLAPLQIVFTVCGFILTIVTTIIVTVYAKKRLSELQKAEEEQQLLLLE